MVKCLIAFKAGAEGEVKEAINSFFVLRALPIPEMKKRGNEFQLELSAEHAEWLAVDLDRVIPDLLVEQSKMSDADGHGKVKFLPSGGIMQKGLRHFNNIEKNSYKSKGETKV